MAPVSEPQLTMGDRFDKNVLFNGLVKQRIPLIPFGGGKKLAGMEVRQLLLVSVQQFGAFSSTCYFYLA